MQSVISTDADNAAKLSYYLQSGQRSCAAGQLDEGIATFQTGLAVAETGFLDGIPVRILADLHAKLADAFMVRGNFGGAAESYKSALRLIPDLTACWCNLGNAHVQSGRAQDAIAYYLQALQLKPDHWPSRTNLVQALVATKQYLIARTLLLELIGERPEDGRLHRELGKVCHELQQHDQAIAHFEQAIALDSRDAESFYWIGGIKQLLGDTEAAQAAYARGAVIQPLIRRPSAKKPAAFRLLALFAPFAGNTPAEFLFGDADYDADTLALLPSVTPDIGALTDDVHVVVNLISDADQAADILPLAIDLVSRLGRPVVNCPQRIMRTTRDATAKLLQGIPACRVPKTRRLHAADNYAAAPELALTFPFLARPAGTHGGDDFEKIQDATALEAFMDQHRNHDRYLIEYIDYRSSDGYFRKYRLIFVGDEIFPYHLAVGNDWKLHRDGTDMHLHPWMQQEEENFLRNPASMFTESHYQALRMIRDRVDLDYFGIDCGLDTAGNVVVFEVNASMLVHGQNAEFPYKDPYVKRIKLAFDAMLNRVVTRTWR